MGTITGGLIAFFVGLGLAGATVVGIVQSQNNANTKTVDTTSVSYGSNK
ncbi:MAG: hypothetical protein ABIR57_11130 [Aeromicrobium sp.]